MSCVKPTHLHMWFIALPAHYPILNSREKSSYSAQHLGSKTCTLVFVSTVSPVQRIHGTLVLTIVATHPEFSPWLTRTTKGQVTLNPHVCKTAHRCINFGLPRLVCTSSINRNVCTSVKRAVFPIRHACEMRVSSNSLAQPTWEHLINTHYKFALGKRWCSLHPSAKLKGVCNRLHEALTTEMKQWSDPFFIP